MTVIFLDEETLLTQIEPTPTLLYWYGTDPELRLINNSDDELQVHVIDYGLQWTELLNTSISGSYSVKPTPALPLGDYIYRIIGKDYNIGHGSGTNQQAFDNNNKKDLKKVELGNTAKLTTHAFDFCNNVEEVTLSPRTRQLPNNAFGFNNSLDTVDFSTGLLEIGALAFINSSIKNLTLPLPLTRIYSQVFADSSQLETLVLPSSLREIRWDAFARCPKIETVTIPKNVNFIWEGVFNKCTSLENIIVDSENSSYSNYNGDGILYNYGITNLLQYPAGKNLTVYELPSTITSVWGRIFSGCLFIEDIIFPNSVVSLGSNMLDGCNNLNSLTFHSITPPSIHNNTFSNTPETVKIYVPNESVDLYKQAEHWSAYAGKIQAIE